MTIETEVRRVATYERVSSEDQRERATIKTQADELARALARDPGVELVGRYLDDGVSGTIPLAERPEGGRLMRDAAAGRFDELHVYKFDRLGRDAVDLLVVRRRFIELEIRVISVVEGEPDLLGYDVQAVVADHARRDFLRRSADGMNRAAREGRYCGGIVAYGYRIEGHKGLAHSVPDETSVSGELSAAGVIRRIYGRLGLDHARCAMVADELNALGVPTHYKRDGRGIRGQRARGLWSAGRIRNMVVNPVYKGEFKYGRRAKKRDREVIGASIDRLVPAELWQAAQDTLARNRVCAKNTRRVYLLRGVIHCAICGLTYVGSQGRADIGWYRCNGRNRERGPLAGRCTGPMVRTDTLEQIVWADIERFLRDPGDVLADLACERDGTSAIAAAEAITLRRALDSLEEQQRTAIGLVVRGILPEAALRPELERIERERATLEPRLAAVEASGAPELPALAPGLLAEIRARLEAGLTIEARQEIVRLLVGQIVIHGETSSDGARSTRAVVEYRFPGAVQTDTGTGSSPPRVRRPGHANRGGPTAA
jgi:site-specific DNA recombinase